MDERTLQELTLSECISGIFIWDTKNPIYFRVERHLQRPSNMNLDIIEIQICFNNNLQRALRIHNCWINFTFWTTLTPSVEGFRSRFRFQVMDCLYQLGVISSNDVMSVTPPARDDLKNPTRGVNKTIQLNVCLPNLNRN